MSRITNVLILGMPHRRAMKELNENINKKYGVEFVEISGAVKGPKVVVGQIWCAVFDGLNLDDFFKIIKRAVRMIRAGVGVKK